MSQSFRALNAFFFFFFQFLEWVRFVFDLLGCGKK